MVDTLSREGTAGQTVAHLAERVRVTRKLHGLTQTQLAGLSGTGLRFISELERGKPTVALDKVIAVLSTLGLQLQVVGPDP